MASIEVSIPSTLNKGAGEKRVNIEAVTLKDAIDALVMMLGNDFARRVLDANGKPKPLINIYINGKNYRFLGGIDAELKDGDKVSILPAVAGGSISSSGDAITSNSNNNNNNNNSNNDLTDYELERYSRQIMLESIGYEGQLRLKNAKVCVVGAGGLGSPIAMQLAAMGIGYIRIVDRDVVELSNLHRQILYTDDDIGYVKVERAARRLKEINPNIRIEPYAVSVNATTAYDIIKGCDLVIDGLDSIDARYALNDACINEGIPYIYGGALSTLGSVITVLPRRSACIRCVFPELSDDEMPTCSIEGVHPSILYMVSAVQVAEAVRIITGDKPVLTDRLLYIDLSDLTFSTVEVKRNEECICSAVGRAVERIEEGIERKVMVEELCGRDMGKRTFSITPARIMDVDLDAVVIKASKLGFKEKSRGDMGITLVNDSMSFSILRSGSAVVVGAESGEDALQLYDTMIK